MGQQSIPSIKDSCYCVFLVGSQLDFRIHAVQYKVAPVILPGPYGIEKPVISIT